MNLLSSSSNNNNHNNEITFKTKVYISYYAFVISTFSISNAFVV